MNAFALLWPQSILTKSTIYDGDSRDHIEVVNHAPLVVDYLHR